MIAARLIALTDFRFFDNAIAMPSTGATFATLKVAPTLLQRAK
jgi:hypothetical protein